MIIGISSEDADALKVFVKKNGVNYPIASADGFPSPYKDMTGIPATFFDDRQGIIQNLLLGYYDCDQLKTLALAADSVGELKTAPDSGQTAPGASATL